ncbi:hypothetical protein MVEG_11288 [Podila verticillata NRRL 6337]|uniref:Uncharacterized protein n=1 Tax=Podila verticillata NRRL 6337 TaxID=1069443 RepID=A0A086TLD5_9FUNG|nr:hypothetical protein MVEG_11288 [Podila verticillata NRRL 6337]
MQRLKVFLCLLLLITLVAQFSLALHFDSSDGAGNKQGPAHQKQQRQHSLTIVSQPPRTSSSDATVATITKEDNNAISATIVPAEPEAKDYVPPSYSQLRRLRGTRPRPQPTCRVRTNRSWFPHTISAFPFHEFPVQGAEAERLRGTLSEYDEDRKHAERSAQIMAKILKITLEELRVMNKESYENDDDEFCITQRIFVQEAAKTTREALRGRWQHQVLSNVCKPEDEDYLEYEDGNGFPWRDEDYEGHEE